MTDSDRTFESTYKAARSGDSQAQEILLENIRPRLMRFLGRRMGPEAKRITEAEDIGQSALLDLLERLDRFPEDLDQTEFLAYALQLGRWRLAGLFSRKKNDVGSSQIPMPPATANPTTGIVTREDDRAWTRSLIRSLDPMYAEILWCYHVDADTVADIAKKFDLSKDAVKQRLSRGRKLLRQKMAQKWSVRPR